VKLLSRHTAIAATIVIAAVTPLLGGCDGSNAAENPYDLGTPGTIEAAVSTDQPPFSSAAGNGQPVGFIIDITNEVARRLHLAVDYKSTTVTGALQGLTSGQYDLASSGLGVTADREKQVAFTDALYWSTTAVLTAKQNTASEPGDFAGKKVGVVTGAVQQAFITDDMPKAIPTEFQDENSGVSQLVAGDLDAFVLGGPDAEAFLKQYPSLKIAVSTPVDHPTAMAVGKNSGAFLNAVNAQLSAIVSDGTFLKIYRKWFIEPPLPQLIKVWPALGGRMDR
jgi:polar amino acid transport system substrate-binding protein